MPARTIAALLASASLLALLAGCANSPPSAAPTAEAADATATTAPATAPRLTSTPTRAQLPAATPAPTPFPTPRATSDMTVEAAFSELSFPQLVFLTHAGDGTDRLFAVERRGRIKVFPNAQTVLGATTFLNITEKVNSQGLEEGLLGLAFDPGYRDNGHFYVYYSVTFPRRSVLSRFSVSATDSNLADPGSERVIMEFAQPYANHNGGHIAFGPDGYLYLGLGDGGSRGDPRRNGQNPGTLLGSILRIDVRSGTGTQTYAIPADNPFVGVDGARPEIWAYGLRNPWRFSFDRETGDLWAGDVGQNEIEEIDLIRPGLNYGWNVTEGTSCFTNQDCDTGGFEPPVAEYGHDKGCSVTGGYVYRGARLPSLNGAYVYGDFCSGRLWALRYNGSDVVDHVELDDTTLRVSSFGEDEAGELYILSLDGGIYRLTLR